MKTTGISPYGYRSYQYLEPGADFPEFAFPPETGRVPSRQVAVSDDEEARVQLLLDRELVISLHDHPTRRPDEAAAAIAYRRAGRDVTGYAGLSQSGMDVVFDNLMNGSNIITSSAGWKWTDTIHDLGMRLSDFAHQDLVVPAYRLSDLHQVKRDGKIGVVLCLEAVTAIENEIDRLDVLYGLGIRSAGLVYSQGNQVGAGLAEPSDAGLTNFGRRVVRRLNQLGVLIDVSHAGDRTSLDAIEASDVPIVISHAGARALWPTDRMKPDDVIRECAAAGGLIGIEAAPHTTLTRDHPRHSIDSVMQHFEYCAELVGIDHVTFGPDTNFGDHVGWHKAFSTQLAMGERSRPEPEHEAVPYVDGIENPAEAFPNIVRWLVSHGYGDDDIAKAIGANTLRVLAQVWDRKAA
jgi:membrane dipeptidase